MYPSSDLALNYEDDATVAFFTAPFEPFNNFSAHTVEIWDKHFNTAEHAFQWKKFSETNPVAAEQIYLAGSPWLAKKIARSSEGRPSDWDSTKVNIMTEIINAKVSQHEDVRDMLLSTGAKEIVENSPVDSYWGCGPDGSGQNQMGKILMEIRKGL